MEKTPPLKTIDATLHVEIATKDLLEIRTLLGNLIEFFHQPLHYPSSTHVVEYLTSGTMSEMRRIYYEVLWDALPDEERKRIENL